MESASPRRASPALSPARIETLADGVFAIAKTLLDLAVPAVSPEGLPNALLGLLPRFVVYATVSSCSASTGSLTTPNSA